MKRMTLQQEIVDALRKAGKIDVALARVYGAGDSAEYFAKEWDHLAARVENARCETCKKYFMATSEDMEGVPCPWAGSGGCWNYQEKASK